MGALVRGREGAEGPRRAADGAARVMLPSGGQAAQPPWGTRLPRPRSQQVRSRGLDLMAPLEPQHHAAWGGPRAGANLAHAVAREEAQAWALGAWGFLSGPLRADLLSQAVREQVSTRST